MSDMPLYVLLPQWVQINEVDAIQAELRLALLAAESAARWTLRSQKEVIQADSKLKKEAP